MLYVPIVDTIKKYNQKESGFPFQILGINPSLTYSLKFLNWTPYCHKYKNSGIVLILLKPQNDDSSNKTALIAIANNIELNCSLFQ